MSTNVSGGYVADLEYPAMFHRETAPTWLSTMVSAIGQQAPAANRPFRYLDLGCGPALNIALLAASNPLGSFVGVDFNESHIARGQELAALLPNLTLRRAGFEELAADQDSPLLGDEPFDIIVLHGVYSWISADARAAVRRIIQRNLAAGGLVYLHYTSHPGQSVFAGAQAMLRRIAALTAGGSEAGLANGLTVLKALKAGGAGYLLRHPEVAAMLEREGPNSAYLAHDLLARDWAAFHVGDVIEEMANAGCAYVGSATPLDNVDALSVPGAAIPLIAKIPEIRARETARDLARNQSMRRDIYRRGLAGLTPDGYREQLGGLRFAALPGALRTGELQLDMPIGPISASAELIQPIRDRLRKGPAGFDELAGRQPHGPLLQGLLMLMVAGEVHPLAAPGADPRSALALNRHLLAAPASQAWLAAPAIGSAIFVEGEALAAARALLLGKPDPMPGRPQCETETLRAFQTLGMLP